MILRRLSQHLREQNWTAITIEFVLLVAGVFLGIQVANWNEDRQQAARQSNYLERLHVDFVGIRDRIQEHFEVYRQTIEGSDYLLSLLRADADPAEAMDSVRERLATGFSSLVSIRVPTPLPATYVEMRSEGQLSYITDPMLRDKLAEYDRLLGVLQDASGLNADIMVQQAPIVQRHFTTRTVSDETALSGIRDEVLAFDLDGMRGDRDFAVAVTLLQRYAHNSRELRRVQLELIETILVLIEQEQGA